MSTRMFLLSVLALALLVVGGCQSMQAGGSASPRKAIVVTSANGGPVAVFVPSADGMHAEALTGSGTDACPDCKAAAEHYFQTGELVKKCPTCGGTRTAVTIVAPASGHN